MSSKRHKTTALNSFGPFLSDREESNSGSAALVICFLESAPKRPPDEFKLQ